jgi:hypothetical protein
MNLCLGSQDHTLRVFRVEDGLGVYTLHGHCGPITAVFIDRFNQEKPALDLVKYHIKAVTTNSDFSAKQFTYFEGAYFFHSITVSVNRGELVFLKN